MSEKIYLWTIFVIGKGRHQFIGFLLYIILVSATCLIFFQSSGMANLYLYQKAHKIKIKTIITKIGIMHKFKSNKIKVGNFET